MLSPEEILSGCVLGVFPMADSSDNHKIYWCDPPLRGIIPLDRLKISKSLRQTLKSSKFRVTTNQRFEEVIRACASRSETWISEEIIEVYCKLYDMGFGNSIEVFNSKDELVGGLYGVALGKAFFGESMFYRERDASKIALVYLIVWLNANGFTLLDTQYITEHLRTLGAIEITKEEYMMRLKDALKDLNTEKNVAVAES